MSEVQVEANAPTEPEIPKTKVSYITHDKHRIDAMRTSGGSGRSY
jgi:hypothetical protein